jgi:hypothetical protein
MSHQHSPERKRQRRLEALRRRADHLQQRIAESPGRNLSYDHRELGALRWAIDELSKGLT